MVGSMTGIPEVEAGQFQGFDEKCKPGPLNERLTNAHRVLGSTAPTNAPAPAPEAVEIAHTEQQDFYVGHDGGHMSLIHSKNWSRNDTSFSGLLSQFLLEPRSEI